MPSELASFIDHTLLGPSATPADLRRLCREALEHRFHSVCVAGRHVAAAAEALRESGVLVSAVVGFPLGSQASPVKAFEARSAVGDGAGELDMVLSIGDLLDGRDDAVAADIAAVVEAAEGRPVKVILETCLLDEAGKRRGCELALEAGAAFVKTSTGFSSGGATVEDVRLLRSVVGDRAGVKASGGIRDAAAARAMIEAGATRLGCSASVAIVSEG